MFNRGFFIRWSISLLGCAAAWLTPFENTTLLRAYVALVILAIAALKQYEEAKEKKRRVGEDVRRDEGITTALAIAAKADLGRKLSKPQKDALAAMAQSLDFGSEKVIGVSYVKGETESYDFAKDIAVFLQSLGFACNMGEPREVYKFDELTKVIGTEVFVRTEMAHAEAFTTFAKFFVEQVPEARFSGRKALPESNRIMIVVGRKR